MSRTTSKETLRAGELARLAGVSTDTLRHYERKGLLRPRRSSNGYREYPAHAVERVKLIRSALAIGFRLDDLTRLLKTREAGGAPCHQVRDLAAAKLDELEQLIRNLSTMRDELRTMLRDWDDRLEQARGEPARLLETLAQSDFISHEGKLLWLKPNQTRRRKTT